MVAQNKKQTTKSRAASAAPARRATNGSGNDGAGSAALDGKSVLVTGGTTGIGRATAVLLARNGARPFVIGRHEAELQDALEELRSVSPAARGIAADVSRPDHIREVFREIDAMGPLDVLINNAAVSGGKLTETRFDDWRYTIETNVLGYIACAREALDRMRPRRHGHIVNVGSMSADLREAGNPIYVATKAAVQAFSESLRKSVNADGIKVTLIEPGAVATPMQDKTPQQERQKVAGQEMLEAEEIAGAILYCLSQSDRCDIVSMQIRPLKQLV